MPEASMNASQRSSGAKAVLPPHALALYQQQITMAHGESSQEVKQPPPGPPSKQPQYNPQPERDLEALRGGSPRLRPRSPAPSDKDGRNPSHTRWCLVSPKLLLLFVALACFIMKAPTSFLTPLPCCWPLACDRDALLNVD